MTDVQQTSRIEEVEATDLAAELEKVPLFSGVSTDELRCMGRVELIHADSGADLSDIQRTHRGFWIMLSGEVRLQKRKEDGDLLLMNTVTDGDTFGEVPLLIGKTNYDTVITVLKPSNVIYLREELFWSLMFSCPKVRVGVLGNMARRLQMFQSQELHREKLISLGTMAAGLMHELNNPGTAARRAASQMRENLGRLQKISLRMCDNDLTPGQTNCLRVLQEQALAPKQPLIMNSLDQSDAEEALAEWMESANIENAWKMAPTLVSIGMTAEGLERVKNDFDGASLGEALN